MAKQSEPWGPGQLISIDANTKRTGVALFSGGGLRAVAVLASKQKAPMLAGHEMAQQLKALGWLAPANDLLSGGEGVVEWPAHYGPYSKAPAKTVQGLTVVATALSSAVIAAGGSMRQVKPSAWKGSATKFTRTEDGGWYYVLWSRTGQVLTADEKRVLAPHVPKAHGGSSVLKAKGGWDDDVLDAVGLGLFALRRAM